MTTKTKNTKTVKKGSEGLPDRFSSEGAKGITFIDTKKSSSTVKKTTKKGK